MIEPINKTKEYVEKMRKKGLVRTFDQPEDIKASIEMNKRLKEGKIRPQRPRDDTRYYMKKNRKT